MDKKKAMSLDFKKNVVLREIIAHGFKVALNLRRETLIQDMLAFAELHSIMLKINAREIETLLTDERWDIIDKLL